jgi:hypothetical protein
LELVADGTDLGARGRAWTRALERGADGPQQDAEHGAGDARIVLEVRP